VLIDMQQLPALLDIKFCCTRKAASHLREAEDMKQVRQEKVAKIDDMGRRIM